MFNIYFILTKKFHYFIVDIENYKLYIKLTFFFFFEENNIF